MDSIQKALLDRIVKQLTDLQNEMVEVKELCISCLRNTTTTSESVSRAYQFQKHKQLDFGSHRANDLFSNGNRLLKGVFHIRCMNNHIYTGHRNFNDMDLTALKENHRVHIFLESPWRIEIHPFIRFIKVCHKITGRKVVIHLPPDIGPEFRDTMDDLCRVVRNSCMIDIVKNEIFFKYDYREYLQV